MHDAYASLDLSFNGVTTPAPQVQAAMMAALAFTYTKVKSADALLQALQAEKAT